jgi:hypothetical protein
LRPYLEDALRKQKDKRTALAIARKLDRDQWRAVAQFDVVVGDDLDQVDLNSLTFRIDVEVSDGWATLANIHWSNLGLEWADVEAAWEEVKRQHREGIFPGGEHDPNRRGGEWE